MHTCLPTKAVNINPSQPPSLTPPKHTINNPPNQVPEVYPTLSWRIRMLGVHLYYRLRYGTRVFYADRVLGYNMSLDEPR